MHHHVGMEHWPLYGLVVRTPLLELRPIRETEMSELIALADRGIHEPSSMPFQTPWTDLPDDERRQGLARFVWRCWADLSPASWRIPFGVWVDDAAIGMQDIAAGDFPSIREAETGSWLGRAQQGQGLGTEMRSAILHLAFGGMGASAALSGAFWDNEPSLGVSRKLGYEADGVQTLLRRGVPDRSQRLRLTRERWERDRRDDITIDGLDAALPLLGLT